MKLEQMSIEELNAADYNPRVDLQPGDAVYESLKRSVEAFGYLQPIIVIQSILASRSSRPVVSATVKPARA